MPSDKFIERYRIDKPDRFRLADFDTADTAGLKLDKDEVKALLEKMPSVSANCRSGSSPRTNGRSWSCCKAWIPPARTA